MKFKLFIPLVLLLLPSLLYGQSLKDGIAALEENKFEEAIEIISAVVESDDEFTEAFLYRAFAYKALDKYDEAIADLTTVMKLDPENPQTYLLRASVYEEKEDYDKALKDYAEALKVNPNYADAYKARANLHTQMGNSRAAKKDFSAYERMVGGFALQGPQEILVKLDAGNYEGALKLLNKEIKRYPREPALYNLRGYTYYAMEDFQSAVDNYSTSIYLDSTFYLGYLARGDLFYTVGQYSDAVQDFEKVEKYGDPSADFFRKRAWAYCVLDSFEEATYDLATAFDMDTTNASIFFTAGDIYRNMDSFDRSISYYNKALEMEDRISAYRFRGRAYWGKEDYDNAIKDLQHYLKREEDNLDEHISLASLMGDAERYEEGRELLRTVLDKDSTFHRAHYRMAMLYFDEEKYTEAIEWNLAYLDVIMPLNDKFLISNCYGGLAWRYLFTGEFDKAEEMAREGIRYDSKNHWIYTNYSLSLLYQGKYDEAYAMYDKYKDETYGSGETRFADTFLKDFDDLEENGITHEDVDKIRELLEPFKATDEDETSEEASESEVEEAVDTSEEPEE